MAWWLPLGTIVLTDIALNFYYQNVKGWDVWTWSVLKYQLFNYVAYVVLILLGQSFKPRSSFLGLLGGGILGAFLFYLITNTASWLFNPFENPEYKHNFLGLLIALLKGTNGWPDAWMFFRNSLLSGGLFTALFVTAMKLTAPAESPVEKEAGVKAAEPGGEETPEEAKA
jgi:multisubunit Na+/H+ antiporter MnhE subunit